MEISVSLPREHLNFLDSYTPVHQVSRSAAVRQAVELLRRSELSSDYAAAFDEWADGGHHEAWDATAADGPTTEVSSATPKATISGR